MRANRDPGRLIPLTAQEIEQVSGASVAEGIGDIKEGVRDLVHGSPEGIRDIREGIGDIVHTVLH